MDGPLIAIADDEVGILDMLDLFFALQGYATVSTTRAAEVAALLQQHRPALLILDLRMEQPDSGWRVLDVLRADPATCQLPVIVCSAERDIAARVQQRADAATVALRKPFDPPQLVTLVQQLLAPASAHDGTA